MAVSRIQVAKQSWDNFSRILFLHTSKHCTCSRRPIIGGGAKVNIPDRIDSAKQTPAESANAGGVVYYSIGII